ncbi:bacterial regulatory helix-turn-helix, lysR family protein, partial [Vibrio parahaemolyticus V-223/04]
LATVVLS